MHTSKAEHGIHSAHPMSRQVLSPPRKAGLHHTETLLGKTNTITPVSLHAKKMLYNVQSHLTLKVVLFLTKDLIYVIALLLCREVNEHSEILIKT